MNYNSHPGQSFSLSLCGPISISRANAHMVHMGYKTSTLISYIFNHTSRLQKTIESFREDDGNANENFRFKINI